MNCVVPLNLHTPHTEGIESSCGRKGSQILKKCMKLNWDFYKCVVLEKNPDCRGGIDKLLHLTGWDASPLQGYPPPPPHPSIMIASMHLYRWVKRKCGIKLPV